MQIPNDKIEKLKQATGAVVDAAQQSGDAFAIEAAKKADAIADDLLRKNKTGTITKEDVARLGLLYKAIKYVHDHWQGLMDVWEHFKEVIRDLF